MKKYFFSGIIHPERVDLRLGNVEQALGQGETELGTMKFNIYNSQITAVIQWEDDATDIFTLRNIVKAFTEPITNLIGFLKGMRSISKLPRCLILI